jgi:hypothetical protein
MILRRVTLLPGSVVLALCLAADVHSQSAGSAKPLYCAFGGVGFAQPGEERQFAVAVVEIDSVREASGIAVSNFILYDRKGKSTNFKRVVEVEVFERERVSTEGEHTYYENSGGTRPWNGTLPSGKIRLRVRVSLAKEPIEPVRFRLTIGNYVIEGKVDGNWPT